MILVGRVGLEPTIPCGKSGLSAPRIPIPPPAQDRIGEQKIAGFTRSVYPCQILSSVIFFSSRGSSSVVERLLAKEKVAGSIPVCRSRENS